MGSENGSSKGAAGINGAVIRAFGSAMEFLRREWRVEYHSWLVSRPVKTEAVGSNPTSTVSIILNNAIY